MFRCRDVVLCLLLTTGSALASAQPVGAAVPRTMSYQGILTDAGGAAVPDGVYDFEFGLYDVSSGGGPLWTETQSAVPVIGGLLAVTLGIVNPLGLAFDEPYWLGISVNGESEMSPRVALTASPYALAVAAPLPANSVDASSVADESGIAEARVAGVVPIVGNANVLVRDAMVTITTPGPGYISVDASGMIGIGNATGQHVVIYGIAETSELTFPPEVGFYYYCGFSAVPNTGYFDFPLFCRRTFYKSEAGSYTFTFGTGRIATGPGDTGTQNTVLHAVYYPTSYGSVMASASGPAGSASAPESNSPPESVGSTAPANPPSGDSHEASLPEDRR